MKIDKKIKGASAELLESVAPIREAVASVLENPDITPEELNFVQNELRRLSREIKRSQKRAAAQAEAEAEEAAETVEG